MKNKIKFILILIPSILLLVPLIAKQFTKEVNWAFGDFIVAAILLYGTSFLCFFILRNVKTKSYQMLLIIALLLLFLLIWAELAVGVFS